MFSVLKCRSLLVSETVFNLLGGRLWEEEDISICGWLDTFNNCPETGLMMCARVSNAKLEYSKSLYAWVYEHRNSDSIMVVIDDKYDSNNMFTEEGLKNAKGFYPGEYEAAAQYIIEKFKFYCTPMQK